MNERLTVKSKSLLQNGAWNLLFHTQLLLRLEVGAQGIVPRCRVRPVDRYSFSAGNW
jgi:hypothetical protein